MKLNKTIISESIQNLTKTTTNKFWGTLAIISSINERIEANKTYRVESDSIMKFLDKLFNLDEFHATEYGNSIIYVKFSTVWKERMVSLTLKAKPNLNDVAVFYNKFNQYGSQVSSVTLKDQFLNDCRIKLNGLQDLFIDDKEKNISVEDYQLDKLIKDIELLLDVQKKESYHLSLESPYFIQSRPSELKRAPFIQTLYSGDRIKELMLLSDTNLEELYPTSGNGEYSISALKVTELINFYESINSANLNFNRKLIIRFISSLLTKPFAILTGLSGSGKTKLAQAFVMWICESEKQYCIVPVGADWTNREPLLGFPNALITNDYKKDEYGVLNLIIDAHTNSDKPYFLILDEMNLSHVERYFADFLSVMESKSKISLHSGNEEWNSVPSEIGFPKNLFIIGTVNIDETTYMFSPKVLDRANVIEFRVTKEEMETYLQSNSVINLNDLEGLGATLASNFVDIAKDPSLKAFDTNDLNAALMSFFSELKKTGAEFGYRSASEILRFAAVINKIEPTWTMAEIIDVALMQKLLPKVHGSRRKLEPVLKTIGQLCLQNNQKFDEYLSKAVEIDFKDTAKIKYPISFEKILRMHDNLISNGFTSYAEV